MKKRRQRIEHIADLICMAILAAVCAVSAVATWSYGDGRDRVVFLVLAAMMLIQTVMELRDLIRYDKVNAGRELPTRREYGAEALWQTAGAVVFCLLGVWFLDLPNYDPSEATSDILLLVVALYYAVRAAVKG